MKRRKALSNIAATSMAPLAVVGSNKVNLQSESAEIYELRTYEMTFGNSHAILIDHLKNTLRPALQSKGVSQFVLMDELGEDEPKKIWLLIAYPDANSYLSCQQISEDSGFIAASQDYVQSTIDRKVYNRYTSMLLSAFDGMKHMSSVKENTSLLELRIYEGQNDDAVRRKIAMFNNEEIDLFLRVGLHPVLFGNLIAGPYRPALVYMLQFEDMEERKANWSKFGAHPDWNAMKVKPEYAKSVSNIRKMFLRPI